MYWNEFLTLAAIHITVLLSPGPNFALTIKNSLIRSRKVGLVTAAGIACGTLFHSAYSIAGVTALIASSAAVFTTFKYLGVLYLTYLGIKTLLKKKPQSPLESALKKEGNKQQNPFVEGFLTCCLNPNAYMLFLTLYTSVVSQETPIFMKMCYALYICTVHCMWFSTVAFFAGSAQLQNRIIGYMYYIEKFMGFVLIGFAVKLFLVQPKLPLA